MGVGCVAVFLIYQAVYHIFTDEATGKPSKKNIPHVTRSFKDLADELRLPISQLRNHLKHARGLLFHAREKRVHPFKDDKILTDWNGLMISALARAGQALDEPRYIAAATKAADFALANLRDAEGRLFKRFRGGQAGLPGLSLHNKNMQF